MEYSDEEWQAREQREWQRLYEAIDNAEMLQGD